LGRMVNITVYLPSEMLDKIETMAKQLDKSRNALIVELLKKGMEAASSEE